MGRDPRQWRLHLIKELLRMIDGRLGIVGEHYYSPADPRDTKVVGLVEWGWAPGEQEMYYSHLNAGGIAEDPLHPAVGKLLFRSFTRRRRDFVSDQDWYSSPIVDPLRRMCNVDDTIHARWRLPQTGWAQFMSLMRPWGDRPFSVRDRFVVNLLQRELGRKWVAAQSGAIGKLPPRLQQTLDMLFNGYSEKEISKVLGLSTHTVHDFTRRLHRHFGVTSRIGLMADADCRKLLLTPALTPAYYAHNRGIADTFPETVSNAGSPRS